MLSKHFTIEEFVPKVVFDEFGENSKWFIRPELVKLAEFVRNWFGHPVIINNWHVDGNFQYRGYRPCSYSRGGKFSQHRLGTAMDFNIKGMTPQDVYKEIIDNKINFLIMGLTTMEDIKDTPTWTHIDIRNWGDNELHIVKP